MKNPLHVVHIQNWKFSFRRFCNLILSLNDDTFYCIQRWHAVVSRFFWLMTTVIYHWIRLKNESIIILVTHILSCNNFLWNIDIVVYLGDSKISAAKISHFDIPHPDYLVIGYHRAVEWFPNDHRLKGCVLYKTIVIKGDILQLLEFTCVVCILHCKEVYMNISIICLPWCWQDKEL